MTLRDDDGYATVPPPAGEKDAYSAETRVGELPPELIAELRTIREEDGKTTPASRPKPASPLPAARKPPAAAPAPTPARPEEASAESSGALGDWPTFNGPKKAAPFIPRRSSRGMQAVVVPRAGEAPPSSAAPASAPSSAPEPARVEATTSSWVEQEGLVAPASAPAPALASVVDAAPFDGDAVAPEPFAPFDDVVAPEPLAPEPLASEPFAPDPEPAREVLVADVPFSFPDPAPPPPALVVTPTPLGPVLAITDAPSLSVAEEAEAARAMRRGRSRVVALVVALVIALVAVGVMSVR